MQYILTYILTVVVFFIIDIGWIAGVANSFYWKHIGHLRAENPNWLAAILFYTIFIGGLIFFCIKPAIEANNFKTALLNGALFGLITYATYDLTNQATLKNWPWIVTITDIAWGIFLCASVSTVSFLLARKFIF